MRADTRRAVVRFGLLMFGCLVATNVIVWGCYIGLHAIFGRWR